jgi:GT2 family glycosyltransferase
MPGDRRALRFSVAGLPDAWIRLDTTTLHEKGMALVRQLLTALPRSDNLRLQIMHLFNTGLRKVIEHEAQEQSVISLQHATNEARFGSPVKKPSVSLVIPLYGRCDYMRHQLAAFAEDRQFSQVDLIYVVDDPGLLAAALDLAGRYQPLFNIPFRVISYGENRGFAGANNAAVKVARAPLLLLMNSDVLPQHSGWIGKLRSALEKLPRAVMTAPLLEYADSSLQHGGIQAIRHHAYPGYVFSHHPGKGQKWDGGDKPLEQLMLTGACLLISKRDYEKAGGLDEGYLVGDFEDSDLSLRLKAKGGRLYLVPAAKLWLLERQSQYLGQHTTTLRDLLTLYNGWRYKQKIDAGKLPDPERLKLVKQT